ncbi:phosphoribosylaminoimidazole carboxylase catalytic subunit [Sulfuriferula multivorans]|uniref:Phosphoribosylaminoimidazole carboxylase catalytic subunit n=1 Tax=Sulfuriferula multivorans TaxID=1559896 RepID=A0A401JI18_9PROT|nr:phosphoribosylaminoimidazole carboxylase catalytic subunit [Sulfuriferula multivorans]
MLNRRRGFEAKVVSTHRTPALLFDYAASGAAHLPGMLAAQTTLPVPSKYPKSMGSLLSIVQMPKGIPVATFAIAKRVQPTAALFAAALLEAFRTEQSATVFNMSLPEA